MAEIRMRGVAALAGVVLVVALAGPAGAQAVTDDWATAQLPVAAPTVKAVTVDPKTTALVVMDFNAAGCSTAKRPRCVADLPNVARIIAAARAHGMFVLHTLAGTTTAADIPAVIAPRPGEPVYGRAGPDKFVGWPPELLARFKSAGITTLITVGTAANGAVLYTASGAAMRGFTAIVPVDAIPGDSAFAEGLTVWELTHAPPTVSDHVTLTKTTLISFGP